MEDRQRERDGPVSVLQALEHRLPVVHLPHEAMQEHDGLTRASLQPTKLRLVLPGSIMNVHSDLLGED